MNLPAIADFRSEFFSRFDPHRLREARFIEDVEVLASLSPNNWRTFLAHFERLLYLLNPLGRIARG